jgi:hypothetical protein
MLGSEEAKAAAEAGKAVQEIAKTADSYEDLVKQFGEFLGRIIGPPAIQASGLIADSIHDRRAILGVKRQARFEEILKERKIRTVRQLPLATAYPLLEYSTLEEDDTLGEMFSNLLVSYVDGDQTVYVPKLFIETLKNLSPVEATLLQKMNSAPENALSESKMMYTAMLPASYMSAPRSDDKDPQEPDSTTMLALSSLQQLGCIEGGMTWGGYTVLVQARVTDYGVAFMAACAP